MKVFEDTKTQNGSDVCVCVWVRAKGRQKESDHGPVTYCCKTFLALLKRHHLLLITSTQTSSVLYMRQRERMREKTQRKWGKGAEKAFKTHKRETR